MKIKKLKATSEVANALEELNWMIGNLQHRALIFQNGDRENVKQISVYANIYNIDRCLKIIKTAVKEASTACNVEYFG